MEFSQAIKLYTILMSSQYKPAIPASGDGPKVSKVIGWKGQIDIKSGEPKNNRNLWGKLEPHLSFTAYSINDAGDLKGQLAPLLHMCLELWGVEGRDPVRLAAVYNKVRENTSNRVSEWQQGLLYKDLDRIKCLLLHFCLVNFIPIFLVANSFQ